MGNNSADPHTDARGYATTQQPCTSGTGTTWGQLHNTQRLPVTHKTRFSKESRNLLDDHRPLVGDLSVLDAEDGVVQAVGQLARETARAAKGNAVVLLHVAHLLHGADDAGSASSEHLKQPAFRLSFDNVRHGEDALRDLKLIPLAAQGKNGVSCDTGKDGSVKRSCNKLLLTLFVDPEDEQVHGADLSNFVILAKEPQNLVAALCSSLLLRENGGRIITATLCLTGTTGPGTAVLGIRKQLDRGEASSVVRAHRGADDIQKSAVGGTHAKGFLGGDHSGTDVERVTTLVRNPAFLNLEKLVNALQELLLVKGRQGQTSGRVVQAIHVLIRAEHTDLAILVLVGLHTLENFDAIVEHHGGRIEAKLVVGRNGGSGPASFLLPRNLKHVIAKSATKDQVLVGGLSLGSGGLCDGQLLRLQASLNRHQAHKSAERLVKSPRQLNGGGKAEDRHYAGVFQISTYL
eukprot:Colp12_sorted_trinity150504_noHs@23157